MPLYVPQKMQLLLLRRQKKTVKQNFLRLLKIEGKKGANLPWKYFDLLMHFVWMRVCCLEVFFLNGAWKNVVFRKWEKKAVLMKEKEMIYYKKLDNCLVMTSQCGKYKDFFTLMWKLFHKFNWSVYIYGSLIVQKLISRNFY